MVIETGNCGRNHIMCCQGGAPVVRGFVLFFLFSFMNVILFLFLLSRIWNEIDRFLYLWCFFAISCKGVAALPPPFGPVSLLNLLLGHCTPPIMSQEGRHNEICHCGHPP